jgi:hypothetical protein
VRLCGICKRSPREDDPMGVIRLHPEDLAAGGQEGAYQACEECLAKWTPIVKARLIRTQPFEGQKITADTVLTPHQLL